MVKYHCGYIVNPIGPTVSYTSVPQKSDLSSGCTIWQPCVSLVAFIYSRILVTCVVMESSPRFVGRWKQYIIMEWT